MSSRFCRLLKEAIKDESQAPIDYAKLVKVAPSSTRRTIRFISSQERRHKKKLEKMRRMLCR